MKLRVMLQGKPNDVINKAHASMSARQHGNISECNLSERIWQGWCGCIIDQPTLCARASLI